MQSRNQLNEASLKQQNTEILLLIFIIISVVGASIFIFYRRRQKQKAALDATIIRHNEQSIKAVLDGQEDERRRIARELHDLVGHHLTALTLNLEVVTHLVDGKVLGHVQQAHSLAKLLLADVREVVSEMRDRYGKKQGSSE